MIPKWSFTRYFSFLFLLASSSTTPASENQLPGTAYASELGAVATVSPYATAIAAEQLINGGNAIDAAIAAALTLGVVDSYNSGIGGGLFALIHWADGTVEAVDAREMAPAQAHRDMYIKNAKVESHLSRTGALAIGVPGSVAAFDYLASKGGRLPLAHHYRSAAKLANDGFTVSQEYAQRLERSQKHLVKFSATAEIFLNAQQQPWPVGHRLVQKDLANTYQQLAQLGADYFYKGPFALKLEQWMQTEGGLLTAEDMANYQLKFRKPIVTRFYDYHVYGFPPPSSGGVHVAQLLNMTEQLKLATRDVFTRNHLLAEAMKFAFADRAYWLGDPDFVRVPKGLVDRSYTDQLAAKIHPESVIDVQSHHTPADADTYWFDKHTTHIATADKQGNWVAITTTLNTSFGSKVIVPGTGVLMNNQMDDFSAQPGAPNAYGLVGSEANSIAPGKRPLSSMSPTIVMDIDKPIMSLGAAGGPMIITQVAQGIIHHLLLNKNLLEALAAPRIHQQWRPNYLFHDKKLAMDQQQSLKAQGHQLKQLSYEGATNAISIKTGKFQAVSEPRLVERNSSK